MEESSSVTLQEQPRTSYEGLIQHLKEQNRKLRRDLRFLLEAVVGESIGNIEDMRRAMHCFRNYWPDVPRIKEEYRRGHDYSKKDGEEQIDFV